MDKGIEPFLMMTNIFPAGLVIIMKNTTNIISMKRFDLNTHPKSVRYSCDTVDNMHLPVGVFLVLFMSLLGFSRCNHRFNSL